MSARKKPERPTAPPKSGWKYDRNKGWWKRAVAKASSRQLDAELIRVRDWMRKEFGA